MTTPILETAADGFKSTKLLGSLSYFGQSIGSEGTCHVVQDIMFDLGVNSRELTRYTTAFLTHGHGDHVSGVTRHAMRRDLRNMPGATYFASREVCEGLDAVWAAEMRLSGVKEVPEIQLVPMALWRQWRVPVKIPDCFVFAFPSTHRIPTQGYALVSARKKLKHEFQGKSGAELAAARAAGVEISKAVEVIEVAFPGDTSIKILAGPSGETVTNARCLILECTFVDDVVSPESTLRTGHVHIEHILDAMAQGAFEKTETLILTHFSARYPAGYADQCVRERLKGTEIEHKVVTI